jgi:erythromycin esterase-like protein
MATAPKVLQLIQQCAQRLRANTPADYDAILSAVGDARVVMIGEASHGIFSKNSLDRRMD